MASPWGTNNPGIGGLDELTSSEEAIIASIASLGSAGQSLIVNAGADGVEWSTPAGGGDVSAAINFGTDNVLIRADGTTKGVQSSGIVVDDSDNVSGVNAITVAEIAAPGTPATGNVVIYAKTDGKLYIKDDAGTETDLTAGGGGSVALNDITDVTITTLGTDELLFTQDGSTFINQTLAEAGIQGVLAEGAFVDGDKTLLDAAIQPGDSITTLDATAYRVFYSDVSGNVTELALGASGTYLQSNGASSAPTWVTPSSTLDEAYDSGGAGAGRSITADTGAVAITVPDTSNNTALSVVQNDVTNNPNIVTITNAGTGSEFVIEKTNDGSTGPTIELYHNSATPAASDVVGQFTFYGEDSIGTKTQFGRFYVDVPDVTNGSEDSRIVWSAFQNGAQYDLLTVGTSEGAVFVGSNESGESILSSRGNTDLKLKTGNATTGSITIVDGANGNINIAPNGSGDVLLGGAGWTGEVRPNGDNTIPLGASTDAWSDLFLGNGAVIDFDSDVTLTHSTNTLTVAGGNLALGDNNITGAGSISFTQQLDNGSKTASFSVDFATDNHQKATLTANTMTITFDTTNIGVGVYTLMLVNPGLATITWAGETGSVYWADGTEPTWTSSGTDIVSVFFDGTNFYCQAGQAFA